MARISECVKADKETPANVIRLVKVSGGFLRAYNKSAWKFHTFIVDYKLKRQFVKNINEEVVSLGFPEGSLHNVAAERRFLATELGYDLELREDEKIGDDSAYEQWVAAIPMSNMSKSDVDALPLVGLEAEKEVVRLIRLFPVERKTPIDCQTFLVQLRELLDPMQ